VGGLSTRAAGSVFVEKVMKKNAIPEREGENRDVCGHSHTKHFE